MKRVILKKAILLVLWSISLPLFAQTEDYTISTDRPSVSFASDVVPKNILQLELGYFQQNDEVEGIKAISASLPNVSFRYGLAENWEIRVGWDYLQSRIDNGQESITTSGAGAMSVGTKIQIRSEADGWKPRIAFLGTLVLPATAEEDFRGDFISSNFRFLFSNNLSEKVYTFYNLGANFEAAPDGTPQTVGAYTWGLGVAIVPQLSLYGELYGFLPEKNIDSHSFDVGAVYIIKKRYQLDAAVGFGLNEYAPDSFFTLGFSSYLKLK